MLQSNERIIRHKVGLLNLAEELSRLLDTLTRRIVGILERRGLLIADPKYPCLDQVPDSSLDHLQAASVAYRIAIGPHAGRKALTLYRVPPLDETPNNSLLARRAGFPLHAATVCEAYQRSRLERLCRYITRPPIAIQRSSQFPCWPGAPRTESRTYRQFCSACRPEAVMGGAWGLRAGSDPQRPWITSSGKEAKPWIDVCH